MKKTFFKTFFKINNWKILLRNFMIVCNFVFVHKIWNLNFCIYTHAHTSTLQYPKRQCHRFQFNKNIKYIMRSVVVGVFVLCILVFELDEHKLQIQIPAIVCSHQQGQWTLLPMFMHLLNFDRRVISRCRSAIFILSYLLGFLLFLFALQQRADQISSRILLFLRKVRDF